MKPIKPMKNDPGVTREFWRSVSQVFLFIIFVAIIYSIYAGIIG